MIKSFAEILNEKWYKPKRIWYHGSTDNFEIDEEYYSDHTEFFLSADYYTAKSFAEPIGGPKRKSYIYWFRFKRPLNIFCTSSKKDRKKFVDHLKNNKKDYDLLKRRLTGATDEYEDDAPFSKMIIHWFKEGGGGTLYELYFSSIIENMGYDGYTSFEGSTYRSPNIALFQKNLNSKIELLKKTETETHTWEEYKSKNEDEDTGKTYEKMFDWDDSEIDL